MFRPRLIPCLLISDKKLVKTKQFKSPKYVGDPLNVVKILMKEVDEIMILDISATKKNKSPNFNLIRNITSECLCLYHMVEVLIQLMMQLSFLILV